MLPALIALVVAASAAQPTPPTTEPTPPADLTRAQARDRADVLFATFDRNGDGVVTREEAQRVGRKLMLQRAATGRDSAPGIGGHTLRFLEQRFATAETVTKAQFEDALLAHFDEMDTDHDGILTAAERQKARGEKRGEPGQ